MEFLNVDKVTQIVERDTFVAYLTSEDTFFELTEERLKVCCAFINNGLGGLGKRIKTLSTKFYY